MAKKSEADSAQAKIFPRNLTARAAYLVAGNPIVTRPEDAVANCYPGLELDVRNLDRRFFPGLVFNFVEPGVLPKPGTEYGAKLAYLDARDDPDLQLDLASTRERVYRVLGIKESIAKTLCAQLTGFVTPDVEGALQEGDWYLAWIEADGKRISTSGPDGPFTGLTVWRMIRGLKPGPVSIGLKRRDQGPRAKQVKLIGWRRLYTDPFSGVISGAYKPGELMQGLCSPWQHDFRDCYCHYWASNRPDIVAGEVYPGEPVLPDGAAEDPVVNNRLDWMRADRSRPLAAGVFGLIEQNRAYQFDHYEIDREWQKLNVVLEGREIDSVYLPEPVAAANPFDEPEDLAEHLREWLTPLEMTLVFEYLYARFSLSDPEKVRTRGLRDALALSREYLLLIAVSEMQHLRWGNEILWELHKAGKISAYAPVVKPSELVPIGRGGPLVGPKTTQTIAAYLNAKHKTEFRPTGLKRPTKKALARYKPVRGAPDKGWRQRQLRLLTTEVQQDFINIEHPSGYIDGGYARVIATLNEPNKYPRNLVQLATRIATDGMEHEGKFIAIKAALRPFDPSDYLRTTMRLGKKEEAKVKSALDKRDSIVQALNTAYTAAASENLRLCAEQIAAARGTMGELLEEGENLANQNIGIPFFDGL